MVYLMYYIGLTVIISTGALRESLEVRALNKIWVFAREVFHNHFHELSLVLLCQQIQFLFINPLSWAINYITGGLWGLNKIWACAREVFHNYQLIGMKNYLWHGCGPLWIHHPNHAMCKTYIIIGSSGYLCDQKLFVLFCKYILENHEVRVLSLF